MTDTATRPGAQNEASVDKLLTPNAPPPSIALPPAPAVDHDTQVGSHLEELLDHVPELETKPALALGIAQSNALDKIGLAQSAHVLSMADQINSGAMPGWVQQQNIRMGNPINQPLPPPIHPSQSDPVGDFFGSVGSGIVSGAEQTGSALTQSYDWTANQIMNPSSPPNVFLNHGIAAGSRQFGNWIRSTEQNNPGNITIDNYAGKVAIDTLGAAGWTIHALREAYHAVGVGEGYGLGYLQGERGRVLSADANAPPPSTQLPFEQQASQQLNMLLQWPNIQYRYLRTVAKLHGDSAAFVASMPLLVSAGVAALVARPGGDAAAGGALGLGEAGASSALDGFVGDAAAADGIAPVTVDQLISDRGLYWRSLGELAGRAVATPLRLIRVGGNVLSSPILFAGESAGFTSAHILYPDALKIATDQKLYDQVVGGPGTIGNWMFQWLPDGGAKTALQDIVNFGASFAVLDPFGAAGRVASIAHSAEGFSDTIRIGVGAVSVKVPEVLTLGHYWGGTSLEDAVRAYNQYPIIKRAIHFISTSRGIDVQIWRPELAPLIKQLDDAKVFENGVLNIDKTHAKVLEVFADANEARKLTDTAVMPMRHVTDWFTQILKYRRGFKAFTKIPMFPEGEGASRIWETKSFTIGDPAVIEQLVRQAVQAGVKKSVATMMGQRLIDAAGDPLVWRQTVGNLYRQTLINKLRSRLGAQLVERLEALGPNEALSLTQRISRDRFFEDTLKWDRLISSKVDEQVRELIETPFGPKEGQYGLGINGTPLSRVAAGDLGSRSAGILPEDLSRMQLPNYHEWTALANRLVKDLGHIQRKELRINGMSLFKSGKAYSYYLGDMARDYINMTVTRFFRSTALLTGGWATRVSLSEDFLNILRQGGFKHIAAHWSASASEHEYQLVQNALVAVRKGVASSSERGKVISDTASAAAQWFKDRGYPLPEPKEMTHFVAALTQLRLGFERGIVKQIGEKRLLDAGSTLIFMNDGHITPEGLSSAHKSSIIDIAQNDDVLRRTAEARAEANYVRSSAHNKANLDEAYKIFLPGDKSFLSTRARRAAYLGNSPWARQIIGAYDETMTRTGNDFVQALDAARAEARRLIDTEGHLYEFDRAHSPGLMDPERHLTLRATYPEPLKEDFGWEHSFQTMGGTGFDEEAFLRARAKWKDDLAHDHAEVAAHAMQGMVVGPPPGMPYGPDVLNRLLDSPYGRVYYDSRLAKDIAAGTVPRADREFILKYHSDGMPDEMFNNVPGPNIRYQPPGALNWIAKAPQFIQTRFLGSLVNRLSRDPTYIIEFARQSALLDRAVTAGRMTQDAADVLAAQRSFRQMSKFIHNPRDKTVLDEMTRTYAPFFFAQMQAWRRVGRLFAENPGAFEQYMKLMLGAQAGIARIAQQNNGLPVVAIPGTEWVDSHLPFGLAVPIGLDANLDVLRTIMPLPYTDATDPVTGQIIGPSLFSAAGRATLLATVEQAVTPSPAPVFAVPEKLLMNWAITNDFSPRIAAEVGRIVLGKVGITAPLWMSYLPNSILDHAIELWRGWTTNNPDHYGGNYSDVSSSYVATQLQVMKWEGNQLVKQQVDALANVIPTPGEMAWMANQPIAGQLDPGLKNPFTVEEWRLATAYGNVMRMFGNETFRQNFINTANRKTAGLWAIKTIAGIFSPVSLSTGDPYPALTSYINGLYRKYKGNTIKVDDALLAKFPWAVFSALPQSTPGTFAHKLYAYPETLPGQNFILGQRQQVANYPVGMAFLIPTQAYNAPFDAFARNTELLLSLRTRDLPADFMQAGWYMMGQDVVYKVFDPATDANIKAGESTYLALKARDDWLKNYGAYYSPDWYQYYQGKPAATLRQKAMNDFTKMWSDKAFSGNTVQDYTVQILYQLTQMAESPTLAPLYKYSDWWNNTVLNNYAKGNFANFSFIPGWQQIRLPPRSMAKAVANQLTYAIESVFRPQAPLYPGH